MDARLPSIPAVTSTLAVRAEPSSASSGTELHVIHFESLHERPIEQSFSLPPAGKKNPLRFAVGRPGLRSSVWRLWSPGHAKSDIYLASRKSAGEMKISFHESGDWRFAFTSQTDPAEADVKYSRMDGQYLQARVVDRWRRPTSEVGLIQLIDILIPEADVVPVPNDSEGADGTIWLAQPPHETAVEVRVVLLEDSADYYTLLPREDDDLAVALVGGFRLPADETALVLAYTYPTDADFSVYLNDLRRRGLELAHQEGFDLSPSTGPRTAIHGKGANGVRCVLDLALPT